mgnify:CR=1 FL=1
MANPVDQTNYIQDFIDNIYTVINGYQSYIGFKSLSKTEDAFIPNYPAITIELENMGEEWKSMPKRKTLMATFAINYYYANLSDKNVRQGLRTGLNKIANCLRENWDLNNYCLDLGTEILSVVPYVLANGDQIIAGGVISLRCNKVISVVLS